MVLQDSGVGSYAGTWRVLAGTLATSKCPRQSPDAAVNATIKALSSKPLDYPIDQFAMSVSSNFYMNILHQQQHHHHRPLLWHPSRGTVPDFMMPSIPAPPWPSGVSDHCLHGARGGTPAGHHTPRRV